MVIHTYLCLSLSTVPKECLDKAVTVAGSAEGSRFREARVLLGLGHSSWEEIKCQLCKLGALAKKRKDGVVPAIQEPGRSRMTALCLRDSMINSSLTLLPNIPLDTKMCSCAPLPRKSVNFTR